MSRLPNLFVPGFQKCATSTMFQALTRHPEISAPIRSLDTGISAYPKEVHFFNQHFDRGPDFYASLFQGDSEYAIDACPNYLATKTSMSRLVSLIPDPKFIVCMRDPVERIASAWNHCFQLAEADRWPIPCPDGSLRDNVEREIAKKGSHDPGGGLFGMGCYGAHIEHGIHLVGKARFHFTFCEWLNENFEREFRRVFRFLGMNALSPMAIHAHQRKKTFPIGLEDQMWLRELYREDSQKLEEILGYEVPWSWHRTGKGG